MKKIPCLILSAITFCFLSCNSNQKTEIDNNQTNETTSNSSDIILLLYPTGCEDESCYSYKIEIKETQITIGGNYYLGYADDKKSKTLSYEEVAELSRMIQNIQEPYFDHEIALDVWGAKLIVNGTTVYEAGDFSFESPPKPIRQLIQQIVKLSPLEIDLYGFS